ncbi:MAG: ATP-dependent sacrificial sulfur transferase LarE [Anaerolineae bacterium]|nr:ATP-dependent sacrificial sulfur transferase LarE [Anaerolineae bacterium]MDW8101051.1 ATP-dependent sacrificial sulfur transferase LarE [Anaerolineae bacterium]
MESVIPLMAEPIALTGRPADLDQRRAELERIIDEMGRVIVAFSAGIDSTLVLKVAHDRLGDNALGVTAVSPSLAQAELQEAIELAKWIGARHLLLETHELDDPNYAANPVNRCYYCKIELYTELAELARREGYRYILNGANLDDVGDYRPGEQAAREFHVRSPLREAGMTKAHVRALARELGLPNWNKPAMACLSSRLPYGTPVTREALSQVERAESYLRGLGFRQLRVRHHGDLARIEVERADLPRLIELGPEIYAELRRIGYTYVTADLLGFRSGSLNEALRVQGNGMIKRTDEIGRSVN